ncbi:hypothetical protein CPS_3528 [Colwellia psychrerythraea 34H]|uniref:Uncharacterized protein n=2 Tax=Colwellia psychrerythraea TaxID=28229 RepID=Q47YB8_COLP3|nr:hypothetical protein CPS_3528 [Colwellia psychrerythraea 34H]
MSHLRVGLFMLEILEKLSSKLQPFRKLTYIVAVLLIAVIVAQVLQTSLPTQSTDPTAMLSFVGLIWLLLFNILLSLFHNLPKNDEVSQGVFTRAKIKLQRSLYHLLALLFIGLTLVIVFLSVRMLRI